MTDKEFKNLSKAQLIEIIYQLQLQIEELNEKNQSLEDALADKRLRIENAGNLAEAALEINNCFLSAQNAAEQYLNEIKAIRDETEAERQRILNRSCEETPSRGTSEQAKRRDHDSAVEAIIQEYKRKYLNNG